MYSLNIYLTGIVLMSSMNQAQANTSLPYFADWPKIVSVVGKTQGIEEAVKQLVGKMTLEEKVGQMIQPDLREVTPEEAEKYKLGSILNGGGAWPNGDKYATAKDWAKESDKYYLALERAYADRGFRIPFAWATDAVHGHNNVFKATLFPHNIGLGAAKNPDLIEKIGAATALEIATTGLDWTFAPTVAVPRDYRWGRVYEGYSEDPEITYNYASRMVRGLQGELEKGLASDKVISTVKHWLGDGGTEMGVDRGENHYSEENLINIHAPGYFAALTAGAQVVMTSFNSWNNEKNYNVIGNDGYNYKLHGSKYIVNDVLKDQMGFDGIVVTDWNGHSEVSGCTSGNCPQAVLAGNDVFMVTARKDWQTFYTNVITQVEAGIIPMSRIDDAVTRILRVKMRAGLWDKPQPSLREHAGKESILGANDHRALAREAVRQSLVLLKNSDTTLPLKSTDSFLVVGSGSNDIQKQTGGWSLTWQGDENEIDRDFPGATTVLSAVRNLVGDTQVFTDPKTAPEGSIAIVVMGEDPYAEMMGDIKRSKTLEYTSLKRSYAADLALLKMLKSKGFKTVTVFFSGRPLYTSEEIMLSDAFVAAWLPGTEGGGITDVLFNESGYDFIGRLSYSWPATKCGTSINRIPVHIPDYKMAATEQAPDGEHAPLFPYGYGLSYNQEASSELGIDVNAITLDKRNYGCGVDAPDTSIASEPLELFGATAEGEFVPFISGTATNWEGVKVSKGTLTEITSVSTTPIDYIHQQDGLRVEFNGISPAQLYLASPDGDLFDVQRYLNSNGVLEFDIDLKSPKPSRLALALHCQWPCVGEVSLTELLPDPSSEEVSNWTTIRVPLARFEEAGMDFTNMSTPFLIYTEEPVTFKLGRVRFIPTPN